jgi:hypothetical protein
MHTTTNHNNIILIHAHELCTSATRLQHRDLGHRWCHDVWSAVNTGAQWLRGQVEPLLSLLNETEKLPEFHSQCTPTTKSLIGILSTHDSEDGIINACCKFMMQFTGKRTYLSVFHLNVTVAGFLLEILDAPLIKVGALNDPVDQAGLAFGDVSPDYITPISDRSSISEMTAIYDNDSRAYSKNISGVISANVTRSTASPAACL